MSFLMSKVMTATLLTVTLVSGVQAAGVAGQGSWETTLQARDIDGNGSTDAFYDTDLNITWLHTASSDRMNWTNAKAWAESSNFFGLSGWRLPTTNVTTLDGSCNWALTGGTSCGYNPDSSAATGSEMAHLFFQSLGNKATYVPGTMVLQTDSGLTNTGAFDGLPTGLIGTFWSGTEYAPQSSEAWYFDVTQGRQENGSKHFLAYSFAVRTGDVVAAVPEPQTAVLALLGLAGVLLARRRQEV